MSGNTITATSTITSIAPSAFIAEKNAFTQNPVVRLYSIYYPGEWYPPNAAGNPTGQGAGYAWPTTPFGTFPLRFAEIVGDKTEDVSYNVTYGGVSYIPYPVNITGLEQASDGRINELALSVYNSDNIISYLVENPYLAGINTSNSVYAIVNGELVYGIDPRTVKLTSSIASSYPGDEVARTAMTQARAYGLNYDADVVTAYGTANAMFDKLNTTAVNGVWRQQKMDTRDLLGAAVEIKTTFANFLDYWPEYSRVTSVSGNNIQIENTLPYRVGDVVKLSSNAYTKPTITSIGSDQSLYVNTPIVKYLYTGSRDADIQGLTLKPDGTKAYLLGRGNDRIYEYDLATAWDISTATHLQNTYIGTQELNGRAVRFNDSGTKMFVLGAINALYANAYEYSLSTAWNVTTASLSYTMNLATYDTAMYGLDFDAIGRNLYVAGSNTDTVYQFKLSTRWSLATASYLQNTYIGSVTNLPTDLVVSTTGENFYIADSTKDGIYQYSMPTAGDVTTAILTANTSIAGFESDLLALAIKPDGSTIYFAGSVTDNVYQIPLSSSWNINTVDFTLPNATPLYINNPQADTSSFLVDNYKIDQLQSLTEQVATFGLVSWLQYFKIVTPKRKYYKNTCQWVYKGPECQYPGYGGISIPGTSLVSPNYPIDVNNLTSSGLTPSLINMDDWTVGTGVVGNYNPNGDGNSRIVDSTPYGDLGVVWDVSNQDAASDADGGWFPVTYDKIVDQTKTYRFSVWLRRKTIGNGNSFLGTWAQSATGTNIGVLRRADGVANLDPFFIARAWWGSASEWYLLVGHVWPAGSGTGAVHVDTGIYDTSGTKVATTAVDFVWPNTADMRTGLRSYLYSSTDTTTNQQFYNPRIDILDSNYPTIEELVAISPSDMTARMGQDICAKSIAACSVRNNSIHYGGFPGVGRTVPQM